MATINPSDLKASAPLLMTAPEAGQIVPAQTLPRTLGGPCQSVQVEITAVEGDTGGGWIVWGYRQYRSRRVGVRQTMHPRRYFVPKPAANQPVSGGER